MNEKTTDMHGKMKESLVSARKYRAVLLEQRQEVDDKIADMARVILGIESMIAVLEPAVEQGKPWQEELTAKERDAAIANAA